MKWLQENEHIPSTDPNKTHRLKAPPKKSEQYLPILHVKNWQLQATHISLSNKNEKSTTRRAPGAGEGRDKNTELSVQEETQRQRAT